MKKKMAALLCLILSMSIISSGCTKIAKDEGNKATGDVIKIGVFEPITGANGAGGALEVEGVKLANKMYPTVLGKKVQLVIVDNKSDKTEAASAAARLVEKEKVVSIIGSWGSSLSMSAGDVVKLGKVPAVGASCTNPLVTIGNDYYFRVCFIDPFQGTVMANYAYSTLGAKKAAIIREISNDYSVGLSKYFTDSFKKLTGNENCIAAVANYNTGDQDFTAQLTNLKDKKFDVIFAPGNFTESALLIKQARDLGIKVPILGGDTWETQEFLDIGKDAVEGSTFSTFFSSEKPITKEAEKFLTEYRNEYKKEPAAVTALGYDAYILILDAIKRAGVADSVKIRDQLAATKNFEGTCGVINFDENRNAIKDAIIKQVVDKKFQYKGTVSSKQ